jgi:tripartite-type tricarboxylate transporter receptor subunit TctC
VTSAARAELLPDIPTVDELEPGYEATTWQGIGAPKHTSVDIIDKLNNEINAGLADPKIKAGIAKLGGAPFPSSPSDLGNFIAEDIQKWAKVIQFSGAKAE